ncbi:hypothetical protein N7501_010896 [Penicillium viridicatum]|nr:hypothetical protein N7501_010896 [Penicillium viridicatum]
MPMIRYRSLTAIDKRDQMKRCRAIRENEAEGLAINLRPGSRPQELENHIQTVSVRSVAHEKATGPQDIRAELPSEPVGRTVD